MKKLFATLLWVVAGAAMAQPANPLPQENLLAYLDQLTQWQREVVAIEPSATNAREIVFRDSLRDNAGKALLNGFGFMRGVADAQPSTAQANDPASTRTKLLARAAHMRERMQTLQGDALRIEQARYDLLQTILANLNSASSKSPNKLRYTIESLTRSIPELSGEKIAKPENKPVKHVSSSILSVSATVFEVTRKQRELATAITSTSELKNRSMEVMKMLRAGLGEEEMPETKQEGDEQLPTQPMTTDERVDAYQRIGGLIIPLAETMRWIDASRQTLREWHGVLEEYRNQLLHQLAVYVGILISTLIIAVLASELARRALKQIQDPKRKRKLNAVRRILTGVAITFILLFNFLSDFGSFATFAGFLTAGLAVALQSVLLSLVAHFLFYGRYGVRAGDRVNVAGVTGDIVQIGWVRFYLRELRETESGEWEPTGKTVALPNSVLFQNIAFSKYPA